MMLQPDASACCASHIAELSVKSTARQGLAVDQSCATLQHERPHCIIMHQDISCDAARWCSSNAILYSHNGRICILQAGS